MRRLALRGCAHGTPLWIAIALFALAALAGCGGGGGGGGNNGGVTVTVSPNPTTLTTGSQTTFTATVSGAANQAVNWSVQENNGGTITSGGLYTAPNTAGTYHVVATSQANSSATGSATVTVNAAPPVSVTVSPANPTVMINAKQTFTATVNNSTNQAVAWSVQENNGGTIDAEGNYTAPGAAGVFHIIATSQADNTKTGGTTVTVTTANTISVAIVPGTVTLGSGGTQTFAATVYGSANQTVTWSVLENNGGTVDQQGHYTAPATAGTFHVKAVSQADPTKTAVATVIVQAGSGTVIVQ